LAGQNEGLVLEFEPGNAWSGIALKRHVTGRLAERKSVMKRVALALTRILPAILLSTSSATAQDKPPGEGDIEAGKGLAMEICAKCHGQQGISSIEGVPHLAGQFHGYLRSAMMNYKNGQRKEQTMVDVLTPLRDPAIENLSAYYSSLPSFNKTLPPPSEDANASSSENEDPFASIRKETATCAGCHGEDGNSNIPGIPSLAGQPAAYFIEAMAAYRDGTRADETMKGAAEAFNDTLLEDAAYFYAAMEPKQTKNKGEGDPDAGIAATASCVGCHALDGNSTDRKTPRLAGLDATYLAASGRAYKSGKRTHAAMQDAMSSFRDSDMEHMATYFATREPKSPPVRKPLSTEQWVERCDKCHGANGNSTDPKVPILAGQDRAYLVNALKFYHAGDRKNQFMFAMSFPMTGGDIEKLARYYASQRASSQ
jgi:cytochrome c553